MTKFLPWHKLYTFRGLIFASLLWFVGASLLLSFYPRYRNEGPPLLSLDFESPFPQPFSQKGDIAIAPDPERIGEHSLRLIAGNLTTIEWRFPAIANTHLRMTCRMRTSELVPKKAAHERGIMTIYLTDENNRPISALSSVGFMMGTQSFKRINWICLVAPETVELQFLARNLGASGTMWVDDIVLQRVRDFPDFMVVQALSFLSFFGLCIFWGRLLGLSRNLTAIPLMLLTVLVIYAAACPRSHIIFLAKETGKGLEWMEATTLSLRNSLLGKPKLEQDPAGENPLGQSDEKPAKKKEKVRTKPSDPSAIPLTKKGHAFFFGLLSLSLAICCKIGKRSLAVLGYALAFLAIGTEILQIPTVGRSPRLSDFALDMAGGLLGLGLASLLAPIKWARGKYDLPRLRGGQVPQPPVIESASENTE